MSMHMYMYDLAKFAISFQVKGKNVLMCYTCKLGRILLDQLKFFTPTFHSAEPPHRSNAARLISLTNDVICILYRHLLRLNV